MRRFSKTFAVMSVAAVTLSLSACGRHGPNSYLMPKEAVAAKLTGAEREFDFIGGQTRKITSIARNGDTIRVLLSSSQGGMDSAYCSAIVEAINDDWTRVTPDCTDKNSAIDETIAQINEMQIDEFVIAVLYDKPVDASMVAKRTSAVAIDNIGAMQRQVDDEISQATDAYASDGWANGGGGSDWGN